MIDINIIKDITTILIIIFLFSLLFSAFLLRKKYSIYHILLFVAAIVFLITTIIFLSTMLYIHSIENKESIWNIATAVYSLLGTILAIGAAFSGIAAMVSYISVNDKLKEAREGLNQARENLLEFRDLNARRNDLLNQIQGFENYQVLLSDFDERPISQNDENKQGQLELNANQILMSEYSSFEHRLKARAVLLDLEANKLFERSRELFQIQLWDEIISLRAESLSYWKLLYQTASINNRGINEVNYSNSLFNYARSKAYKTDFLVTHHSLSFKEVIVLWEEIGEIFLESFKINKKMFKSISNYAVTLDRRAMILLENSLDNLSASRELWKSSYKYYEQAISIIADINSYFKYEVLNDWADTLVREASSILSIYPDQALILFDSAYQKYIKSLELKVDYNSATDGLYNIINLLENMTFEQGEQENKEKLFFKITTALDSNRNRE